MKNSHVDFLGNVWPTAKLTKLLADPDTSLTVQAAASFALQPNGTWKSGAVRCWAETRYGREEPVALLLLLVAFFFDTDGRRYLTKEGGR